MYEIHSYIRYSETDATGQLSFPALMALLQDIGYAHAEARGGGVTFERRVHQTWYLLNWQVDILSLPPVGTGYTLQTWICEKHGMFSRRNFLLLGVDGTVFARANALWIYMDTLKKTPMKPPTDLFLPEDYGERMPEMEYAPRKIPLCETGTMGTPVPVTLADVDTNHHMNNLRYLELGWHLAGMPACRAFQGEYCSQAYLGQALTPKIARQPGKIQVELYCEQMHCATFCFVLEEESGVRENTEQES